MKYEGVCIAVKDVTSSKKFYQELFGLEVLSDYGINVSFGGLSLQQEFDWMAGVPKESILEKPHNMELYFEEDDFDRFIAKLEQRTDIQYIGDGVKEAGWGQRSIRFYDLDGHIIEVGENLKMVVKRFLDSGMSIEETSEHMDVPIPDLEKILQGRCSANRELNGRTVNGNMERHKKKVGNGISGEKSARPYSVLYNII